MVAVVMASAAHAKFSICVRVRIVGVCFERLADAGLLRACGCGHAVHAECMQSTLDMFAGNGQTARCTRCQTVCGDVHPWQSPV